MLALRQETKPSLLLLRRVSQRRPEIQVALIAANLPSLQGSLERGCIVSFNRGRVRVRPSPINDPDEPDEVGPDF
jgi:hypothetical protein